MNKQIAYIPCTFSDCKGLFIETENGALPLREIDAHVFVNNELAHFLKWFLVRELNIEQIKADVIARSYVNSETLTIP